MLSAVNSAKNKTAQVATHKNKVPSIEPMLIIQLEIFVSPIQDIKNAVNLYIIETARSLIAGERHKLKRIIIPTPPTTLLSITAHPVTTSKLLDKNAPPYIENEDNVYFTVFNDAESNAPAVSLCTVTSPKNIVNVNPSTLSEALFAVPETEENIP